MVNELKTAVVATMLGDADLTGALAANPADASKPAIFAASRNKAADVYPSLTYRVETTAPDKRFREPFPVAPGAGRTVPSLAEATLEFEAWDDGATTDVLDTVAERLKALFHDTAFDLDGGRAYRCELEVHIPDGWDANLNVYFALLRFRLRVKTGS